MNNDPPTKKNSYLTHHCWSKRGFHLVWRSKRNWSPAKQDLGERCEARHALLCTGSDRGRSWWREHFL